MCMVILVSVHWSTFYISVLIYIYIDIDICLTHVNAWESMGKPCSYTVNKNYVQPNNMYHAPTDLHAVYTNSSY